MNGAPSYNTDKCIIQTGSAILALSFEIHKHIIMHYFFVLNYYNEWLDTLKAIFWSDIIINFIPGATHFVFFGRLVFVTIHFLL